MKAQRIIVFLLFFLISVFIFSANTPALSVSVSAESAVLINAENGEIYFEKNAYSRLPMASTTKIMTALVALENSEPDDAVFVDARAVGVEGSSVYLTEGELLTMEELLYALLLSSANDAAAAIAYEIGGSIEEFAEMMNIKAEELGLHDTHFENPHGLDSEAHYTTARDLAFLTAEALKNETFARIVSTYKTTIPCNGGSRYLINHNKLLKSYDGAVGVKTGFTKKSGRCLVSAAERDGLTLIAVTIKAPDDWNDHKAMLDCGFSAYHKIKAVGRGDYILNLPVSGGKEQSVLCTNATEISATLPSSVKAEQCVLEAEADHLLTAPVKKGEAVGRLICRNAVTGDIIGEAELKAEYSVPKIKIKRTLFQRILQTVKNIFS